VRKIKRDIRDVLEVVQVSLSRGYNALRLQADQVVHDGQIVRGQIPDDVDVVLKEPKVDAGGVVVVEAAQDSLIHELSHLAHGAGEQEGVVHHDDQILPLCELDQFFCLL